MVRPGSDEEKEYIIYLMKKYGKLKEKKDHPVKKETD
jgi:hypothetical protein